MPALPLALFCNLSSYPLFRYRADQWSEEGWVYDPRSDRYIRYYIDRKDQYDVLEEALSRAEFIARVLPIAPERLAAWFESFTVARTGSDTYIRASNGTIVRFSLGALEAGVNGMPRELTEEVSLEALPGAVRQQLTEKKPPPDGGG
jgi:hypothetical protein